MSLIALHYNIIEKIGSGSFGTVYKVEDIWSKKLFAIKVFDKIPLADIKEKLIPEMMYKITNLSHENLIRIFDYGTYQNSLYSLLEYCDGQSLQDFHLTKDNKKEFLKIIVQACYALHHLHSHNIIHKDLKLENILYKKSNGEIKVKVYDFGFNKIISPKYIEDASSDRDIVTPPYFPPEVLQGGPFSPQSDFYSLGIILYYLSVGAFPFSKEEIELMTEKRIPNIIPQFPNKINPVVDKGLEELIFRMIEFNPNMRFKNTAEIIQFINKTQRENFPLSLESQYIGIEKIESKRLRFRETSILSLKDYVKMAASGNGKVVFVTGDYGIGKKESMLYLKCHLLSKDYYVFFYRCNALHRDPFFMLCKEIFTAQNEKDKQKFATEASEKFREFLFRSEEKSHHLTEDKISLQREFLLIKNYIYSFSKIKPIIYFISNIDMAEPTSIDFLKFISKDIYNYPILIAVSTEDTSLADRIESAVQLHLQPLSRIETSEYVKYLLEVDCPKDFLDKIYYLSNGNQLFIRDILVSLIKKKAILSKNGEWNFNIELEKIKLPSSIDNLIHKKIEKIPQKLYPHLTKLSALHVPISPKITNYILSEKPNLSSEGEFIRTQSRSIQIDTSSKELAFGGKELFFFLEECENLGLIVKDETYANEGYYKFAYPAVKNLLLADTSPVDRETISKKIIKYFKDKKVTKPSIMDGIIAHCQNAKDYESLIKYQMAKTSYFFDRKDILNAWDSCYIAVKNLEVLRQKAKEKIPKEEVAKCLIFFMKISITLERYEQAVKYYQLWEKAIEPDFQMLLLYSKLLIKSKKFNLSLKTLQNAEKIASSKEKNDAIISLIELYTSSHQLQKPAKLIKRINPDALSPEQKAEFYLQKANFHYTSKEYNEATESLKLGEKIAQKNSLLFELGRIYKVMADTYNMQNLVEKATRYYKEGAMISEEEGDLLNLANVFSHWGFLELKKGKLQSAIGKLKKALHYFQLLNYPRGIAEVHLNLALTKYKLGEFRKSEKHFQEALKEARRLKETKLVGEILRRYSFLKLKISHPAVFLNFLQKNYTEFSSARAISLPAASLWQAGVSRGKEGKITEINSFLKNYIFYLVEIGKEKSIESILKQIETQKVNYSLEQEFILQVQGWIKRSKGDLKSAVALFKRAATIAKTNQNEYALMINYFNVSETYFINGNIGQAPCNTPAGSYYTGQAEIYCDLAASLAIKNQFARWQNFARIMQSKIFLKKPQIKLRVVLRNLLFAEKVAKEMKDWSLICQSQFYIMLIYRTLHLHKLEQLYRKKYVNRIAILTKGLNKTDQEFLKDKFNYSFWKSGKNIKEFITLRPHISALKLQHQFFDLLQLTSGEQIKSSLKKYMKEILGIEKFAIMLAEAQKDEEEYWLNCGFSTKGGVIGNKDVLNSKHQPYFEKAIGKKKIQYYKIGKINYCIVPLLLKQEIIGTIILSDDGELPFTKSEKLIIKLFGFYLTVILKKVGEYQAVLEQREHFSQLLAISRDILQIMNLSELENQIVLNALQLSGAERGFFITLDESNNFVFNTAFMKSGEKIDKNNLKISKTVLKDVYETGIAISTIDAIEEAKFFDSNSINSYDLHSIYCAPIRVHNSVFGFLYLDNLGSKQKVLHFNEKLLELFLLAAETAIKNSLDYQKLCIANEELLKLDQERADFINISSHEFNTPIQTLRGYLNILKDEKISTNIKANTIKIMERNISRLIQAISNVIQVNALEKSGAKVTRELINISDILKIVYDETKVFSDRRKQKLVLKIAKDIKQVYAERICLINAMKNLVLNAIKFTEDYGQIIIGARKPKFKNEEINGRETVIIYVKDNGIGIASYELENIFKEFYEIADIKAHHSGLIEFKSSGLGLGLPVTKSIVELFGGKIWAESVKGEGSTFFIALPVSYEETPEAK